MMLLPHNICRLLLEVMYNSSDRFIRFDTDEQVDMILVNLVYFYLEVPVFLLCYFHCGKQVISNRIEHLPPVLGREDEMITQKGLCMVKSFIFAHTHINIVKK